MTTGPTRLKEKTMGCDRICEVAFEGEIRAAPEVMARMARASGDFGFGQFPTRSPEERLEFILDFFESVEGPARVAFRCLSCVCGDNIEAVRDEAGGPVIVHFDPEHPVYRGMEAALAAGRWPNVKKAGIV